MKIAMVAPEILPVPPVRGGAVETYIDAVSLAAAPIHDVTVYCLQDPLLVENESSVKYVRIWTENHARPQYIRGVIDHMQNETTGFDVIEIFNRPLFVLRIRDAGIRTPLILSMHSEGIPFSHSSMVTRSQGREVIAEVTSIVTVSEYFRSAITSKFPEAAEKIRAIYPGVCVDTFVPSWTKKGEKLRRDVRTELGLGDGPVLLFAGRLDITKGLDVILRAMPRIFSKYPAIKLLVAGGKFYGSDEVDKYVRLLYNLAAVANNNVVFLGFVSYPDVARYFCAADILVSASQLEEPLGRVHCEAMAAGLPIIAANRGGINEVVTDGGNGLLVDDYTNPKAFARTIDDLLRRRQDWRSMGYQGRQLAQSELSFQKTADEVISVLKQSQRQ